MDLDTASVSAAGSAPATLRDTLEAQRYARRRAGYRHRIVEDVDIDPSRLGEQGLRILDWLLERDERTEGVVEPLGAIGTAAQVAERRAQIRRTAAALRESESATEAALAQHDERWGNGR